MARSLEPIAGVDVGNRQREKDKADRQHGGVHHDNAPGKYRDISTEAKRGACAISRLSVTDRIGMRWDGEKRLIGIP
jgi:hypothetical protein